MVSPRDTSPGLDPDDDMAEAAWFAIDHADWIGAVVSLARVGPGAVADAESLAHQAAIFDFEEDADAPDEVDESWQYDLFLDNVEPGVDDIEASEGEAYLRQGFFTVERMWRQLGAIDRDDRLTELGWWGLPEALLLAWHPSPGDS